MSGPIPSSSKAQLTRRTSHKYSMPVSWRRMWRRSWLRCPTVGTASSWIPIWSQHKGVPKCCGSPGGAAENELSVQRNCIRLYKQLPENITSPK